MFTYEIFKDEEEAMLSKDSFLLPPGEYRFTIVEATAKTSHSGNSMIELKHKTIHKGKDVHVFGYLVGTKGMSWMVKHFCESVGLDDAYANGTFNERMAINKRGFYRIDIEKERAKPDGSGFWKAKNKILDYLKENEGTGFTGFPDNKSTKPTPKVPDTEPFDDELPF